jgi:hypothetical protein
MTRAGLVLCTFLVGIACDQKAAEEARATAAKLAEKEREIVDLRARVAAHAVAPSVAPPASAPATPAADASASPGQVDPELVRAALAGASKMKLELEADGSVRKIAVYHHDAATVPEAVTKKALETFPGATIRKYETEFYRDKGRVFEVEVTTADKQSCEVSARADGSLVYTECELPAASLPAEIVAAVARDAAGRKTLEAERKNHADGSVEFVVEVAAAPDPKAKAKKDEDEDAGAEELYYDAAGKLLRREIVIPAEIEITRP